MKQQLGRLTRRRKYFARLYDDNPAWHIEHANDLAVFHKIAAIQTDTGEHPLVLVRRLMKNPDWGWRLTGKTLASWKDCYNRWRRKAKKRDKAQVEKYRFHPYKHWSK